MALPSFLLRLRNRLLTDPKFLALAQKLPFTRPVARRKSLELFDILAGFSYSQVLSACLSLNVLQHVGLNGIPRAELIQRLDLPPTRAEMLLRAAVALQLLDEDGNSLILGSHGAALVAQPWIMRFVEHHRHFYRDLEDPVALLRGKHAEDGLRSYWSYDAPTADKSAYSTLMAESQKAVAAQIVDAYDFGKHRRILDVGGGTGAFLRSVGARYPQLELNLFDLPGVVSLPAETAAITRHAGDFRSTPLPQGMDIITVVRVLHDHDDDVVLALLRNIRAACQPHTTLLVAEPFAGQRATARVSDAYFGLYFAAMGQGRTRTPQEVAALAAQAGFGQPRQWPTHMPLITSVMTLHPKQANV